MEKEKESLEETYEAGYRRLPETPDMGEAQMAVLEQVLGEEERGIDSGRQ